MKVEILGPGCPNCQKLEDLTTNVIEDMDGKEFELEKIEEPEEIVKRGVMNTPALAVDGEVKVSGRVPSEEEIREMLG